MACGSRIKRFSDNLKDSIAILCYIIVLLSITEVILKLFAGLEDFFVNRENGVFRLKGALLGENLPMKPTILLVKNQQGRGRHSSQQWNYLS